MSDPKTLAVPPPPAGELDKINSAQMLTVGCKLPNGLICEMGKVGDDSYKRVILNGANSSRVIGGYGLTQVSKDFWEAWSKKNKHLTIVRQGLVFAHTDEASATSYAKERAETRTGLEALDPTKALANTSVEADMDHFNQGKRDIERGGFSRRAG